MKETIYVQMGKSVQVQKPVVKIKDIARISCVDKEMQNRCENMIVMNLNEYAPGPYSFLAIDLLSKISEQMEGVEIVHIGEVGVVVNYEPKTSRPGSWDYLKTAFVCLILFFGAGFSIMTFNTDVNTRELFTSLYEEMIGVSSSGFTEMELLYSLGIGVGVVFFFNHFRFRKKKQDPSALEVRMCLYENDVDTTVLNQESKGA